MINVPAANVPAGFNTSSVTPCGGVNRKLVLGLLNASIREQLIDHRIEVGVVLGDLLKRREQRISGARVGASTQVDLIFSAILRDRCERRGRNRALNSNRKPSN